MNRICLVFITLILCPWLAAAPSAYKVETIGPCSEPQAAEAIRNTLQAEGLRVTGEAGPLYEVWLRKVIRQKPGSKGSDYNTLANGTFVGIIVYRDSGGDYRGQAVKPGVYTLRYQAIPIDGNHMGVSPTPDFFILSPADADQDPDAVIGYADLMRLSVKASGTNHPHALNLAYPEHGGKPGFHETEEANWFLELKTRARPADGGTEVDFPAGIVLIGKAEG